MKAVLFFLSLALSLYSQKKDTLRLYYAINADASPQNDRRIDSLSRILAVSSYSVWIFGYADFLHSDRYNLALSQRRADAVKARLLANSPESGLAIQACEGRGEKASTDNGSSAGEALQRRVDVVYTRASQQKAVSESRPSKLKKRDTLHGPKIDVKELKAKGKIELEGLSFIPGRHTLLERSLPTLEALLNTMLQNPELKIEIQGHICCWEGPGDAYDYDSDDMKLSHNRAKAIYEYLIEHGVEAERLSFKGFGRTRPKVKEVSPETEQMNRRVEIRVIE